MTDTSTKPKAIQDLDEARKILDEVDSTIDTLTVNGALLPPPFGLIVKILDALRKVTDVVDDFADARYPATPATAQAASAASAGASYDPTKSTQS